MRAVGNLVDVTGWSTITMWIALSLHFAFVGNEQAFQAVGVVGIAAGVGYFALQRHATPHPYGLIESNTLMKQHIAFASDAAVRALAHNALIAKTLIEESKTNGKVPSQTLVELANVEFDHVWQTLENSPDKEVLLHQEIEVQQLSANQKVLQARRNSEILQAVVVVFGTLQSGLGSFLISAVKMRMG